MATPFDLVVEKMRDLGFFQFFLPFILTAAIFYGLLRKTQIFGDPDRNVAVNGTIAMVASFMVWSAPILLGINIEQQLARFFLQGVSAMLMIIVGVTISGVVFGPDLPKQISEKIKTPAFWWIFIIMGILIGGGILFSSGMAELFFPKGLPGSGQIPQDIIVVVAMMMLLVVTLIIIVAIR